jgi:hypothetical protein
MLGVAKARRVGREIIVRRLPERRNFLGVRLVPLDNRIDPGPDELATLGGFVARLFEGRAARPRRA